MHDAFVTHTKATVPEGGMNLMAKVR